VGFSADRKKFVYFNLNAQYKPVLNEPGINGHLPLSEHFSVSEKYKKTKI
jgi:hypothetical protein